MATRRRAKPKKQPAPRQPSLKQVASEILAALELVKSAYYHIDETAVLTFRALWPARIVVVDNAITRARNVGIESATVIHVGAEHG